METTNSQFDLSKLSESFQALLGKKELTFQFFDMLPTPIEIWAADGTTIYVNRACMEMVNCMDASLLVGKYNLKNDPVCIEICGQDVIDRIFRGESIAIPNFPAPIQDVVDRGVIGDKPWEAATMDLYFLPIWDGDVFICTICFFTVKNVYKGRADIVKAQEYIDGNWREEFDSEAVARALNISHAHLRALFKQHTGMTLYEYYKKVKVERIKENLADRNLSIAEAFDACGEDSRGAFARTFKEMTGMSPKEYRGGLK